MCYMKEAAVTVLWLLHAMKMFMRIWEAAWAAVDRNEMPGSISPLVHHRTRQ
jgi:hypothetical protein